LPVSGGLRGRQDHQAAIVRSWAQAEGEPMQPS